MTDAAGPGAPDDSWEPWTMGCPFEGTNGIVWRVRDFVPAEDEYVRIGFRAAEENCNFRGGCHGGWISTLCDISMGRNVHAALDGQTDTPTMSMTVDFVRGAVAGDWLESRARVVRRTRRVVFVETRLIGPKGVVARASGLFATPNPQG